MKLRILSIILLACCLIVPAFAQTKPAKAHKATKVVAKKGDKKTKVAKKDGKKVVKTSASGKMKDLGNGVFEDSKGKYRDASGKFMSKKDAEAKLGKKSGPARDPKTGRFVKKDVKKGAKPAKKGAKPAKKVKAAKKP